MITISITAEELRALEAHLWANPCHSGCVLDKHPKYDCYDLRDDGTFKCPIKRGIESLEDKINAALERK